MKTRLFLSLAFVFLMQGFFSLQADYSDQAERLDALTPDNRIIAEDLMSFMKASDDQYFSWVETINKQSITDENFDWITEYSDFNVKVMRGDVVEKIGRRVKRGRRDKFIREKYENW